MSCSAESNPSMQCSLFRPSLVPRLTRGSEFPVFCKHAIDHRALGTARVISFYKMSVASLEDSEEPFLTLSQQIASSFVDIYLSQGAEARKEVVPKYVAKSPFGKNGKLVSDGPGAGSEEEAAPQHTEQPAVQVRHQAANGSLAIYQSVYFTHRL